VSIEELVQGAEEVQEDIRSLMWTVLGDDGRQLIGEVAQLYVVADQLSDPRVGKALADERKEESFGRDGLVKHFVAQVVHEAAALAVRPPPDTDCGTDGLFAGAYLVEQDGVLVGKGMLADPVLLTRPHVGRLRRRGRGLPFRVPSGHHTPIVARRNLPD
jgi:hypothetical protein